MRRSLVFVSVVAAGLALVSAPTLAHHGDAGRYEDALTTVTGTVVEVQLVSPHSTLILDVTDANGKVLRWHGEAGAVMQMARFGWKKGTVKPGDTLTMTGRRAKNGTLYMTLSEGARVVDASGKELFRGNDAGQPPGGGPAAERAAAAGTPAAP